MAITNLFPSVWAARLLVALEKNLVFGQPAVVNTSFEEDVAEFGKEVHVHSLADPTLTAYIPGTTNLSYEVLTDSRVTLPIDQFQSFSWQVEDIHARQMQPKVIDAHTSRSAYKFADIADQFIAGKYTEASSSAPDNIIESTQATKVNIYEKVVNLARRMDDGNLPADGRFLVVKPWIKELMLQNADLLNAIQELALTGSIGRVAGINIFVSNNVVDTGSAPVITHNPAGVPSAWSFISQINNVEQLRLEAKHASAVRGLYVYGAKVIAPARLWDLQLQP